MQIGALEYLISINDKGVQSGINRSEQAVKGSASRLESSLNQYGNRISAWTIAKGQMIANVVQKSVSTLASSTKRMVQSAVMSFAEYEQLVGGIETLFKKDLDPKAFNIVMQNAKQAFKTAGISANEYMETVTSFSASLLQSLEGDTAKAAEKSDMAIKDMSDNANKMGSSMESIMNAYRGFSKQNYTMLDNLKLGYGGTKGEMERLLKDAEKLSGVKYDISNLSDVYDAIHEIQKEMGILGTTQKEAEGTITGSMSMMKASWRDLLTSLGSGENLRETSRNLTKSLKLVLKNVTPVAQRAFKNIFSTIKDIMPDLKNTFREIWSGIKTSLGDNPVLGKLADKVDDLLGFFNLMSDLMTNFDLTTESLLNSQDPLLRGFGKIAVLADNLVDDVNAAVKDSDSLLLGLLKGTSDFLIDAVDDFVNWLDQGGSDKLASTIVKVAESLSKVVTEIAAPLATVFGKVLASPEVIAGAKDIAEALGTSLLNILMEGAAGVLDAIGLGTAADAVRNLKVENRRNGEESGKEPNKIDIVDVAGAFVGYKAGEKAVKEVVQRFVGKSASGSGAGFVNPAEVAKATTKAAGTVDDLTGIVDDLAQTLARDGINYVDDAAEVAKQAASSADDAISILQKGKDFARVKLQELANRLPGVAQFANGVIAGQGFELTQPGQRFYNTIFDLLGLERQNAAGGLEDYVEEAKDYMAHFFETQMPIIGAHATGTTENTGLFAAIGKFLDQNKGDLLEGAFDQAEADFNNFKNDVGAFTSQHFTLNFDIVTNRSWKFDPFNMGGAGAGGGLDTDMRLNAKGNWDVPYDNYPALLHRGEMVLTKSQARKLRDGEESVDYSSIGAMVGTAVESAMNRVYVMMSGEKVGDLTTRRVRKNMNANSASRLRALGG